MGISQLEHIQASKQSKHLCHQARWQGQWARGRRICFFLMPDCSELKLDLPWNERQRIVCMAPCQELLEAYRKHVGSAADAGGSIADAMKRFQGIDNKELVMSIPNV